MTGCVDTLTVECERKKRGSMDDLILSFWPEELEMGKGRWLDVQEYCF